MNQDNKQPEAGAVAFFGYKRTDGFEISLTLRDDKGSDVMKRLDAAIEKVKKDGGTPLPLRGGGFAGKQAKPKDYVEGRMCPKDNGRLVRSMTSKGPIIKCENNKYDFASRRAYGCPFTEWEKPMQPVQPDFPPVRQMDEY